MLAVVETGARTESGTVEQQDERGKLKIQTGRRNDHFILGLSGIMKQSDDGGCCLLKLLDTVSVGDGTIPGDSESCSNTWRGNVDSTRHSSCVAER